MVDKYEVKKYIAQIIGEEYIIPTLGIWEKFDDINFECLPNQFVLKCTHDSGGLVICRDKKTFDRNSAKKIIEKSLKRNFYFWGREWPYKEVKPRIIAEKYMEDDSGELKDYKIHNFNNGKKIILVCKDRFSTRGMTEDFFDESWNHLDIARPGHKNSKNVILKPKNLEKMLCFSEKLAHDIPFLRVDFYEVGGKVFFGELTFYPSSGFISFEPSSVDQKWGEYIDL